MQCVNQGILPNQFAFPSESMDQENLTSWPFGILRMNIKDNETSLIAYIYSLNKVKRFQQSSCSTVITTRQNSCNPFVRSTIFFKKWFLFDPSYVRGGQLPAIIRDCIVSGAHLECRTTYLSLSSIGLFLSVIFRYLGRLLIINGVGGEKFNLMEKWLRTSVLYCELSKPNSAQLYLRLIHQAQNRASMNRLKYFLC